MCAKYSIVDRLTMYEAYKQAVRYGLKERCQN